MCYSFIRPGTSYHVTQFYQAFPRVSTASDNAGVRRPGGKGTVQVQMCLGWLKVALLAIWSKLTQLQNSRNVSVLSVGVVSVVYVVSVVNVVSEGSDYI